MEFRKTVKEDIDSIMNIIKQAQSYFKKNGVDQWQNNYPNIEVIDNDIRSGNSYVLLKDKKVVATVAISFSGEKTYEHIYEGAWISNDEYAVVHRVAVDNNHKGLGLASQVLKDIEELCINKNVRSIKVDTHECNLSMQKLLRKNKFEYCGLIYLEDNSNRLAFEKTI